MVTMLIDIVRNGNERTETRLEFETLILMQARGVIVLMDM